MRNAIIRRVIIFGALACLSLLAIQSYWVLRTWDIQEQEFNRRVNQALLDAANQLAQINVFALPKEKLVQQISTNYWAVNINNMFEASELEHVLARAFERQGLKEDYEYGIFDCSSDQMVRGKMVKYSLKQPSGITTTDPLPKHDDQDFIYYFGILFPNKSANLLGSMWLVIGFTVLLLFTVSFFIYSMTVILRQKQLSELQRDFINNMTHEFKTPIATISLAADNISSPMVINTPDKIKRFVDIIRQENRRMNSQVERVLQMALIDKKDFQLKLADLNLHELIEQAVSNFSLQVEKREGSLRMDLGATNPIIEGDATHIAGVIHNLLDNANKYSPEKPDITISTHDVHMGIEVVVTDKGMGISKEVRKHIFDKFYREHTGNVHNVKGFGLGLSYVKAIMTAHKGLVDVHSEPGKGSSFILTFPR